MDESEKRVPVAEINCDCGRVLPGYQEGDLLYWTCPECGEMSDVDA